MLESFPVTAAIWTKVPLTGVRPIYIKGTNYEIPCADMEEKMSYRMKLAAAVGLALTLTACATTQFISTWANPTMGPIERTKGATVIACVAAEDKYIRYDAEDALAGELARRGFNGVQSYKILPPGVKDEALAKAAFEKSGAVAVVVMRPLASQEEVSVSASVYTGPYYGGFWGGYWGYGWGAPYSGSYVTTDTIVIVETLLYSLKDNKLVWSGRSKTTNPSQVASFVKELVSAAGWEMNKAHVFK